MGACSLNTRHIVYPLLKSVVRTPFFGHYKINLCSECELWKTAPVCKLRDCGVCECAKPPSWADDPKEDGGCDNQKNDRVDMTIQPDISSGWVPTRPSASLSPATATEDVDDRVVVDLRRNPE